MNRIVKISIVATILIIALGVTLLEISGSRQTPTENNKTKEKIDYKELEETLSSYVQNKSPEESYQKFKELANNYKPRLRHDVAHVMGRMIFNEKGLEGVTICDSSFQFGCYHSFFSLALEEFGPGAIEKLNRRCVEEYGNKIRGCQHGIGHGLLEYYGDNELTKALEGCEKTSGSNEILGCTSGVFMEYNFSTIERQKEGENNIRKIKEGNVYEPCNTEIPKKFKKSCYFEISQWWNSHFKKDKEKLGKLCHNLPDESFKDVCYMGIGTEVAIDGRYSIPKITRQCRLMPNNESYALCLSGATWGLYSLTDHRSKSPALCLQLENSENIDYCFKKANLINTENFQRVINQYKSSKNNYELQ